MVIYRIGTGIPTENYFRLSIEPRILIGWQWRAHDVYQPWRLKIHLGPVTFWWQGHITPEAFWHAQDTAEILDALRCPNCLCTAEMTPDGLVCSECGWYEGAEAAEEEGDEE